MLQYNMTLSNIAEAHKEMLYTKYESSRPSSLRGEEFRILHILFLYSNFLPPGRGPILTPGASYEQTW